MIPLRLDRAGLDQRAQREVGGGRIAARRGDALRRLDLVAEEFGQAVGEAAEQVGPGMRLAVPALIIGGAVEAEVGAEVDQRHAGREQVVGQPLGLAMRQARRGSGRCP